MYNVESDSTEIPVLQGVRVSIGMTPSLFALLVELCDWTHATGLRATIRAAITLYHDLVEAVRSGGRVYVQHGQSQPIPYCIPGAIKK